MDFPCSGTWGAEVLAQPSGREQMLARTVFRVTDGGSTPAIGAPAPRSENLTASSVEELHKISTDPEPQLDAYRSTIRDAVTSGKPSVVFFATPAFCQSGVCGPTVEMVKAVVGEYRADLEYVTIEPYKLLDTANRLQPDLDEEGRRGRTARGARGRDTLEFCGCGASVTYLQSTGRPATDARTRLT